MSIQAETMAPGAAIRLDVAGVSLEAAWWGTGSAAAPTFVLLHEGLGSVALWRDFPQRLAQASGWRVFAYSRPGYGRSDGVTLPRPLRYLHDEAARLPAVLDAAGIEDAVWVGHSDGASIAAIAAGSQQERRASGLVLIAPHFFVEPVAIAGIEATRRAFESGSLRRSLARYHDDVDTAFWGWCATWLDPAFRPWRIDDLLPHIDQPILVVQGENDVYATDAQVRVVSERAPGPVETTLLPGVGHSPHLEAPDLLIDAVASFARRHAESQHGR